MKNTENDFINENYGLAISLARKFYSHGLNYDFEDILQVALMSMLKAYDETAIDEVLPDNLDVEEQAIFYYKRSNYKDMEIRDILDMSKKDYKAKVRSFYNKLRAVNE